MSIESGSNSSGASAYDLILDRCRVLGLPCWRFDAEGALLARPSDVSEVGRWLRSEAVERVIAQQEAKWREGEPLAIAAPMPGLRLIPVTEHRRKKRLGTAVAAVLGPDLLTSGLVERGAQEIGTRAELIAELLARVAVFEEPAAQRLALCLGWIQADLDALVASEASVGGFSRQLADTYEEITLLQTLGRSMNELAQPQRFVALACAELQATLPFDWIATRFVGDRRLARSMAGRLHVSGAAPLPRLQFDDALARVLALLQPGATLVMDAARASEFGFGAGQMVAYPVVRGGLLIGAVCAGGKHGADPLVSSVDIKLLEASASFMGILLDNAVLYDDQQLMFLGTLEAMTSAIDAKDPYTCGHSERVAELAARLAAAHGLDEEHVERVRLAGIVHDVGKIGVPEAVLCKTGRLTEEEFSLIKQHPEIGHQILRDIPQFEDLLPGVLSHHERFDGKGYPHRLVGEQIPLMARIIGLVDAFDAMSSNRTYRSAMQRERVMEELADHAGSQFDPALVESFARVDLTRYDELVEKHQVESSAGGIRIRRRGLAA